MELTTLQNLYLDELKDVYSAEQQILQALPKMTEAASAPELKQAFAEHLEQTQQQVQRLQQLFQKLNESPTGKECKGMQGLIEEGEELIQEGGEPEVLDAGLIAAAQRVEHYEIAAYGTCRTYAQQLGDDEAADLLQQTLDEEGQTDKKLTSLAEQGINVRAQRAA